MSHEDHEFTLAVRVYNKEEQLLAAALAHPDSVDSGYTREDLCDAEGEIDVNHCLVMLLDPGTLAGCAILDSGGHQTWAGAPAEEETE